MERLEIGAQFEEYFAVSRSSISTCFTLLKFFLIAKIPMCKSFAPVRSLFLFKAWSKTMISKAQGGGGLQMRLSSRSFDPGPSHGNDGSGLPSTRHSRARLCCGKMMENVGAQLMEVRS